MKKKKKIAYKGFINPLDLELKNLVLPGLEKSWTALIGLD